MQTIIDFLKSFFIAASVDTLTKGLNKTVSKLEAHTSATAAAVDATHEAIDFATAEYKEKINNLSQKAVDLRNEAQKAAAIARNIGVLLQK